MLSHNRPYLPLILITGYFSVLSTQENARQTSHALKKKNLNKTTGRDVPKRWLPTGAVTELRRHAEKITAFKSFFKYFKKRVLKESFVYIECWVYSLKLKNQSEKGKPKVVWSLMCFYHLSVVIGTALIDISSRQSCPTKIPNMLRKNEWNCPFEELRRNSLWLRRS